MAEATTKPAKPAAKKADVTTVRLRSDYNTKFVPELEKELGLKNVHQLPKLEKIVLNVGLGRAMNDKKVIETAKNTLTKITGQHPQETFAKKSIAGFKLRDFHGVSNKAFDKAGNYSMGFTDQSVFPELSFDETTTVHGIQVVFVISAHEQAHAKALLTKFGMPFEKENK
jgi:large subunit ribosomal protein L5